MAEIQGNVTKKGKQNWASGFLNAKGDKDAIATWKQDLMRVLQVFNVRSASPVWQSLIAPLQTELAINTHVEVVGMSQKLGILAKQDGSQRQHPPVSVISSTSMTNTDHHTESSQVSNTECEVSTVSYFHSIPLGELPPPAPKSFFGRTDLIGEIVGRAEQLESIALIGAGGIGKTSIALTVLHDDRIKHRFGDNRRFIRCDKFSASHANFLAQLSKVIGSGINNPEDLAQLRPFLSSKTMILFLDNAESILDPRGTDALEIYTIVEELSQFTNICLGITSRISTLPPQCKRLNIPTLSMEAARDIFYSIYGDSKRPRIIDNLLRRLDFHALSIKLLATVASHNLWDHDRLVQEWGARRAQVLRTDFNESLAVTMELSLSSPTFRNLNSDARELLGVVAFFPQGINENNLDWLFPATSNRRDIFDKFCVLSLTSRSGGFITMLAPIRDYLRPRHPQSSPLLCATRDRYFTRLSVDAHPEKPGFEEAQWITSEDVNVEHLLYVFASIHTNSHNVWDVCFHFMEHLSWHKPRQTVLRPKIEGLSDEHCSKAKCLFQLSQLFERVGNQEEEKQLLTHTLKLERQGGNDRRIAQTLRSLSDVNRKLGRYGEGIQQAEEAMEIYKRLGDTTGQAYCWNDLAAAFSDDKQLDAAEDAASRAINIISEKAQESLICESHQILGHISNSKGETEKAIHHLEIGLEIASAFNRHDLLFWILYSLVRVLRDQKRFNDANALIERLKSCAADNLYDMGSAMEMQARIWHGQRRLGDAKSEMLGALEIFGSLEAARGTERCSSFLRKIEREIKKHSTKVQKQGEPLEIILGPTLANCS